ncbi:MAG TPA: cyclic nucleotide-binding domain-containing protein [Verrucomicrobiae bacterium]
MQDISGKVFALSSQIEVRDLPDGTRLLKQLARIEYLALNAAQQNILKLFDGRRTVEAILHGVLQQQGHPDIRGFYDLVLTAINRGFLIEIGTEDATTFFTRKIGRSQRVWNGLAAAVLITVLGGWALAVGKWRPVTELNGWFQVLLFVSLGLSLSSAWAAAALDAFGRSVYQPRFRLDRLIPFFSIDTRDAFMGGRVCEVSVAAQALAAPFLLAAFAWLTGSDAALLGSALTAVILGSPFGPTPAHTLLHALLRKEYELPRCADQFLNTKLLAVIFDWKTKLQEERYFLGYCTYAILWLGVTFRFANKLMAEHGRFVSQQLSQRRPGEETSLSLVVFWLLAIVLIAIVAYLVWLVLRGIYRAVAPKLFDAESKIRQSSATALRPSDKDLVTFLGESLLCAELNPEARGELAKAMQYALVEEGATIIRERDVGESMFIVYRGTVEVLKEEESGRERPVAKLARGDAFGEIALLDKVPRTSSVKALEKTALLVLARPDFERILVNTLGSAQIKTLIQVSAFLRRNALFARWHPPALFQISKEFVLQECAAGQVILKAGQINDVFYMVYDGEFTVVLRGEKLAILKAGDFCGEISLLKNIPATADVIASEKARCLRLEKDSFLRLVSKDFLTGLAIESTVTARRDEQGREA